MRKMEMKYVAKADTIGAEQQAHRQNGIYRKVCISRKREYMGEYVYVEQVDILISKNQALQMLYLKHHVQ